MSLYLLLFSYLICLSLSKEYDFNLTVQESKLLTWTDSNGKSQQLLLSQSQIVEKTVLVKKLVLPYSYLVDQNCEVTQSLTQAIIFEANTFHQIKLQYIYVQGQQIISKSIIDFSTKTTIELNDKILLHISSQSFLIKQNLQSQSQELIHQSLYMYSEQNLVEFESELFSYEPSCYILSPMTYQLCKTQQCFTLPPQQIYQMQIGTIVKNYSLINNQIILPTDSSKNQLIYLKLQSINTIDSIELQKIKQQTVIISGHSLIKVNFQLSQITHSQNNTSNQSLRVNTQSVSQFSVKIIFSNPQPVYSLKTIKLFKGGQLIESNKVMFKPLQQISYSTVWKNNQSQLPAVQIYSENLQLQGRYTMNNYIGFQYDQQTLLMKNSPSPNNIQTDTLEQVTTTENHTQNSPLIIVLAISFGTLFLFISGLFFFRKNIFKRCYKQQKQQQKKQNQVKKEKECQNIQSAKHLRNDYEFTFQRKQSLFTQTPSTLSKFTSDIMQSLNPEQQKQNQNQNQTQNLNPQQQEQNQNQCSIEEQLPQNLPQQKTQDKNQPQTTKSISQSKTMTPPCQDRSLSLTSNYSKSYTKKPLTKKNLKNDEQQEQTQNV